jgi:hypothetical protein
MRFDPTLPVAVFLGPSLDRAAARAILPANYYPPVRMGDIYRLGTCGVRLIVIIDGVFHGTTPVWQREIVSAMRHGITVVGASSMGALRAIELASFGMLGLGTIVEWYRSGFIEGDDEVALLHADGEYAYRTLSEPLVNMRWNLIRAAEAGVLSVVERDALVAAMQRLDYGRRGYPALFDSAAFARLSSGAQAALRTFLFTCGENLKQMDAARALEWCAARLPQLLEPSASSREQDGSIARHEELLGRGIPAPNHALTTLRPLLVEAAADRARTAHIVHHASRRFYLLEWARMAGVRAPDGLADTYTQWWMARNGVCDESAWRAANGIAADELGRELADRAFEAWLLERGPHGFGLDRPFLEAWAGMMGIDPPVGVEDSVAFRAWLVEKTPNYFGFDRWSTDVALARELQLSGEIARLAAAHGAAARELTEERADAGAGAL